MSRIMLIIFLVLCSLSSLITSSNGSGTKQLRFNPENGKFRILQVTDMNFADGWMTPCEDVLPNQFAHCSDHMTSEFIYRLIEAEKPDLIVFTGYNIYGPDATDAVKSLNAAFSPAINSKIPWAAVLGNHDQESTLSRKNVMKHIVGMENTLSQLNPSGFDDIDGYGNYNLEVYGAEGSSYVNDSILNLYFLDSGDYSTLPSAIPGYGWIKPSQQRISSAYVNSGFFTRLVEQFDVKAVFTGHDHLNDFCGELAGINLCYGGGSGYHGYGKAGWSRRARMVEVSLRKLLNGEWGSVKSIKTWKRLDDENLTPIDGKLLWTYQPDKDCIRKGFGYYSLVSQFF
ncbi:probable inactive purple acid phosphatase 29 [Rutidosis leptorrhynchoides]|uniref:probable inactive purple acid phosphatase 29 n=1 Tax=Rutidosis leptorrhynchoides TaxID=125765 RepID=UPI003A98F508